MFVARVAVAPANCRGELVQRPAVAERDVVARPRPSARGPSRRPRATRCPCSATQPRPGREVDLGHGVEVGAECADARRLVAPEGRLVGDERRDRDVVLGARGGRRRELRRQPEPVGRGIEDRAERPALGLPERLGGHGSRRGGSRARRSSRARATGPAARSTAPRTRRCSPCRRGSASRGARKRTANEWRARRTAADRSGGL